MYIKVGQDTTYTLIHDSTLTLSHIGTHRVFSVLNLRIRTSHDSSVSCQINGRQRIEVGIPAYAL